MTSSYAGYFVSSSIRSSLNSEPTPPQAANCCIVACQGQQLQSSRDSHDELIVKNCSSSARKGSDILVALQTAENETAYNMHQCRCPSFEMYAVKQPAARRTAARALDIFAAIMLPCNTPRLCKSRVQNCQHCRCLHPRLYRLVCRSACQTLQ